MMPLNLNQNRAIPIFLTLCGLWWTAAFILMSVETPVTIFKPLNEHISFGMDSLMVWVTKMGEAPFMIVIAFILIIADKKNRNTKTIALIVLILALPPIITGILKSFANAPRPLSLYGDTTWIHIVDGYDNNYHKSWPSGHTTAAFASYFLLTLFLKNKYRWCTVIFFALALLTGYSRIQLSQHFFEDVVAGSIIGTAIPYFIVYGFQFLPNKSKSD